MIFNKEEIKAGYYIINSMPHFKQTIEVIKIDDEYVYGKLHGRDTVMPINFYLNKAQFTLKEKIT